MFVPSAWQPPKLMSTRCTPFCAQQRCHGDQVLAPVGAALGERWRRPWRWLPLGLGLERHEVRVGVAHALDREHTLALARACAA
jgi:hypothetical protein